MWTTLRPAEARDVTALAPVWQDAWYDGHRHHVPDALLAVRGAEHFVRYLDAHLAGTTVAVGERGEPVGLVIVDRSAGEVVQLAVSRSARGAGTGAALLHRAETVLSVDHDQAWLAVVPGNTRARAFYRHHGWQDEGPYTHRAPAGAATVPVPVHRYVTQLRPGPTSGTAPR